ncbi:hypothetical protein F7734_14480 [Scytonema sp. UIC 10036]|uniref:nSTAND1 domain-containing NTPase n=1 Tax=Scytonema sp. UIC 10036 TaxID=2304196 RepID=UPI0012DAB76A|nr:hypothetical protein [Scytonema sp. UIC 10036]MUG93566.1 hypothetical protein [Scytonema sp. UIC 10036]
MSYKPYLGLKPYEQEDAILFFGREMWRQKIIDCLRANKLTVLYGESGVGKSSLLQAGVFNHLYLLSEQKINNQDIGMPKDVVVIFRNWQEENLPSLSIKLLEEVQVSVAKLMKVSLESLKKKMKEIQLKIEQDAKDKKYALPSIIYRD